MAKVKISPDDVVALPKAVLEAHGIAEGDDVEVSGDSKEVRLRVASAAPEPPRKLTPDEFVAGLPRYKGPAITEALIEEAIAEEVRERWERKSR